MRALSIRQPWAWLILHGGKDVENRDWSERYPALREARELLISGDRFAIHASKGMTRVEYEDALSFVHALSRHVRPFPPGLTMPAPESLPRGAIVGTARIAGISRNYPSPWFFGPVGIVLRDAAPLSVPIPCKGMLGFFDVPDVEAP